MFWALLLEFYVTSPTSITKHLKFWGLVGWVFDGSMLQMFHRHLWIKHLYKVLPGSVFLYFSHCGELCIISVLAQGELRGCKHISEAKNLGTEH